SYRAAENQCTLCRQKDAQRWHWQDSLGILCRRICLRLWLDALHRSNPGYYSYHCRFTEQRQSRHLSFGHLFDGTRCPFPADLDRHRSLSRFLLPLSTPPPHCRSSQWSAADCNWSSLCYAAFHHHCQEAELFEQICPIRSE